MMCNFAARMKWPLLPLLVLPLAASAQSITYEWLNLPCASQVSCDTGCTACNASRNSSTWFTGTDAAWLGVDVCPHPIRQGDNALFVYGWPTIVDADHAMMVTGIAFSPVHVDSVIITHRSGPDGPQRILVSSGVNESMSDQQVSDLAVPGEFGTTVLTDLGDVLPGAGMAYGFFSLMLQPYLSEGGAWEIDALRIVGSPAQSTGVTDLTMPTNMAPLPKFDALGRTIIDRPGLRFYLDGSKHVTLGR